MTFRRSAVSTWFRDYLRNSGIVVELVTIEDTESMGLIGWDKQYAPDGAEYTPYAILVPQTASKAQPIPIRGFEPWNVPYTLTGFGVNITQVEDLMDTFRELEANFVASARPHIATKTGEHTITKVECTSIGGVGWNNSVQPPMYSQSDSDNLTATKE